MSNVYHTGCLHLGHESIAKMRGFSSSQDHDELLVENWNKTVNKRDKVFIHGDITRENSIHYPILKLLNGVKHVVLGNHDRYRDIPELMKYVDHISGPMKYKGYFLSHIPIHPSEFDYRVRGNIHAHVHRNHILHPKYFNVDIHERDMKPVASSVIQNTLSIQTI